MSTDFDPHALEREDFVEQVHSFEFWFQAVEGYLTDRPYGYREDTEPTPIDDDRRDNLITTLCNYCVGETAALDGTSGMIDFAPNRHSKIFLATQAVDEARHLEVFSHRLLELGVSDPEAEVERRANPNLLRFKQRLHELIDGREWEAALFAQNVILETMEHTVFQSHAESADPITAEILDGVMKDERRHLGFGENDLGRLVQERPDIRARLADLRAELDPLVLGTFEGALDDLGIERQDRPELGRDYLDAIERLGLT
ncbi:MAG: long-chain fatty aldehyde decarbonylase [Actinomycetia bacterium]|nr:long-chain fatty aldehyde decarbonylase [Actinomycetes bacterium]